MQKRFTFFTGIVAVCLLGLSMPNALRAQVTTYPYVENFDGVTPSNTGNPLTEPNSNVPTDWTNVQAGDGPQDWYGRSTPTGSASTGPASDHTSGTGVYMFVEDSGGGANNDTVSLETPLFNIKNLSSPRMAVWVHSDANIAGASFLGDSSLNHIHIDIFEATSGTYVEIDSIGALNAGWTRFSYDLSGADTLIRFRFRVNNNNFGDFIHDIAIDDFSVFSQPAYELAISLSEVVSFSPLGYVQVPVSQMPSYIAAAEVVNLGDSIMRNAALEVDVNGTAFTTMAQDIASGDTTVFTFLPIPVAQAATVTLTVAGDSMENNMANNVAVYGLQDSVFARADSTNDGGLGFNTATGEFGNMYGLTVQDTLTSVSILLTNSTASQGDNLRVTIYKFNEEVPGAPDTTVALQFAASPLVQRPLQGWFTIPFPTPLIMPADTYFIAIEQTVASNLGIGFDLEHFTPGVSFFRAGSSGSWSDYAGLPATLQGFNLIQANFGPVPPPPMIQLNVSNDTTICAGDSITLVADAGAGISYSWSGGPNTAAYRVAPTTTTLYTVTASNATGDTATAGVLVTVNPLPLVAIAGDTIACAGSSVSLQAGGSTASYTWSTGQTGATISVTPTMTTTYTVTGTDNNGCQNSASITVDVAPLPSVAATGPAEVCAGESATLNATATGGTPGFTFDWSDGQTGASVGVSPTATTTYTVTATDANGCADTSSITVAVNTAPTVTASGDTAICAGDGATLTASGAASYSWSSGQTMAMITVLPAQTTTYTVTGVSANGCRDTANLEVVVNALPAGAMLSSSPDNGTDNGSASVSGVTGTGPFTYSWSNGATGDSITGLATGTYTVTITDANGCSDTASVTVQSNVSISRQLDASSVQVSPNPATEFVRIEGLHVFSSGAITLTLLDAAGRQISAVESVPTQSYRLELPADLAAGVYTLKIRGGDAQLSKRVLVE